MSGGRFVEFPINMSLGTLYTRPTEDTWRGSDHYWPKNLGDARGRRGIPDGHQVRLWASQRYDDHTYRSPTILSPLRDFAPDALDSLYVAVASPDELRHVRHLEGLHELILDTIDDDILSAADLGDLPRLRGLHTTYTKVTGRSIEPLVRRYTNLRFLYLSGTDIGDETLRAAANLDHLTAIRAEKTTITDEGARCLAELPGLTEVDLSKTEITDAGLDGFAALNALERLWLSGVRITDRGLGFLARTRCLRSLDLSGTDITGSAIVEADLHELQELDLADTVLTGSAVEAIGRLSKLVLLRLSNTELTPGATRHLRGMPMLRRLTIPDTGVTPAELLDLLESLPKLRELWVGVTPARSEESIRKIKERLRKAPSGARQLRWERPVPTETRGLPLSGTWETYEVPVSADMGTITGLAHDPSGRLWVTTAGSSSTDRRHGPSWRQRDWTLPRVGSCVLDSVAAIAIGPDGAVHVSHAGELWVFRSGIWRRLIQREQGPLNCLSVGPDGTVWAIRNHRSLYSVRGGEVTEQPSDVDGSLLSVAVAGGGAVWVGSSTGVCRYSDGSWRTWKGAADGLPVYSNPGIDGFAWERIGATPIRSVTIDDDSGAVWVTGSGGISRYADGDFELVASRTELPFFFSSLTIDGTGQPFAIGGTLLGTRVDGEWRVAEAPTRTSNDGVGNRPTYLRTIEAGPDGLLIGGDGAVFRFTPTGDSTSVPAPAVE